MDLDLPDNYVTGENGSAEESGGPDLNSDEVAKAYALSNPIEAIETFKEEARSQVLQANTDQEHKYLKGAVTAYDHVLQLFSETQWLPPGQTEEVLRRVATLGDELLDEEVEGKGPGEVLAMLQDELLEREQE